MHESGVVKSLIHEVERIARRYGDPKVLAVRVRIGALCPFSESHLREHFLREAEGTILERALLTIEPGTDPADPSAQDILLLNIDVEDILPMTIGPANVKREHGPHDSNDGRAGERRAWRP